VKLTKRIPSGKMSRVAAVDSPLAGLALIVTDGTGIQGRGGRWHIGKYIPPEFGTATRFVFNVADGSRLELAADEVAAIVGAWNSREADRRELAARHDAADAYERHRDAADRTAAELARITGQPAAELPRACRYASPAAQAEADAATVAAVVTVPALSLGWQPDPRCVGGYVSTDSRAGWRYSVRPLGIRRGGYALATFDGYGVARASLAEYATAGEAQAAAESHASGNWPAGAGIRWEAAGGLMSARYADVPGGRLHVQRTEPHSRSFRASVCGEHAGTRLSCQAAMAAAVAEYMRRRAGPDTLRDAPGRDG
jgi:hypothetical protein